MLLSSKDSTFGRGESDLKKAELLVYVANYNSWVGSGPEEVSSRYKRSLELRRSNLGPEHADTWSSMGLYFRSLTHIEAPYPPDMDSHGVAEMGAALLNHQREVFGLRSENTIGSMTDMARFLDKEGKFNESEALQRQALSISAEVGGHRNIRTAECMEGLATVLLHLNRFDEVLKIRRESTEIRTELLGPDHRIVLREKSNLALSLRDAGRLDEAIGLGRETMLLSETIFGSDHPHTLIMAKNVAHFFLDEKRYEESHDILGLILDRIKASQRVYTGSVTAQEIMRLQSRIREEMEIASGLGESPEGAKRAEEDPQPVEESQSPREPTSLSLLPSQGSGAAPEFDEPQLPISARPWSSTPEQFGHRVLSPIHRALNFLLWMISAAPDVCMQISGLGILTTVSSQWTLIGWRNVLRSTFAQNSRKVMKDSNGPV